MNRFFYPKSVVVIGVSASPNNMGRLIVQNLIDKGFGGQIHAVGVHGGIVFDIPIHQRIQQINSPLDMAVILTPAATVPGLVEECGRAGIRRVIIESGGFSELSPDRKDLENELLEAAKKYDIRFIGPNCIGVFNSENGLATPFFMAQNHFEKGNVSVVAQSGGVCLSYMQSLSFDAVYFNKAVSIGNKLNVDESDLLEYLAKEDQGTKIICMYLESIKNGRRFLDIARQSTKPIIVHKAGIGNAGAMTAASHTAALSADDKVVSAAFEQAGIIRVHTMVAMMDLVKILQLPPMKGKNLSIVSRSGGHAVIAADTAEHFGFDLPVLPPEELLKIQKYVRGGVINLRNPLDLGDLFDLSVYEAIVRDILGKKEIDGMVLVHGYQEEEKEASRRFLCLVRKLSDTYQKPVALCLMIDDLEAGYLRRNLDYPFFKNPEQGAWALSVSHKVFNHQQTLPKRHPVHEPISGYGQACSLIKQAAAEKRHLNQAEGFDILKSYHIPVPAYQRVRTLAEATAAADEIGYPVVLKADLSNVLHKTEAGGVWLNLGDPQAVSTAFLTMERSLSAMLAPGESFAALVMAQAPEGGQEVMFGMKQDSTFGPTLLFGMGGVWAELLEDVSLRVAPVERFDVEAMVREIRGYKLLAGARGKMPKDIDWLVDHLFKFSRLAEEVGGIKEIDFNPVMIYPEGGGGVGCEIYLGLTY